MQKFWVVSNGKQRVSLKSHEESHQEQKTQTKIIQRLLHRNKYNRQQPLGN